MAFKHHDEAREEAVQGLLRWLSESAGAKAVLIDDLYGKYRVILWPRQPASPDTPAIAAVNAILAKAAGRYWSGQIWLANPDTPELDRRVYDSAWSEGRPHPDNLRLRILDRVRNRAAWFGELADPPWRAGTASADQGPPIVVFYSFKGGVGRTTALASFALQRARAGERVVVVDGDLDAPGIGPLMNTGLTSVLAPDPSLDAPSGQPACDDRSIPSWGVVDYLLEAPSDEEADLSDYYLTVRNEPLISGAGEIIVFPAGRLDEHYLGKLARLDFSPPGRTGAPSPWTHLLDRIRRELQPRWILLDSRAGLGEPAGLLLGGMAHLHVLFGASSEQSWQGLRLILERIGSCRVRAGKPQAECILVQTMIPEFHDSAADAKAAFLARSENEFENLYYAEDPSQEEDDFIWRIRDMPAKSAPHNPVFLTYKQNLAHFRTLHAVLPDLLSEQYQILANRIQSRFAEDQP